MPLGKDTLFASYQIDHLLGRGGMGEVYLATHRILERRVALKLLAPELAADKQFRERFLSESRLAASLDHPNVVTVYEAGQSEDQLYLAMRYVEGADLKVLLQSEGPLAPERVIALLGGVADALDAAHTRGLVHRDVKPGNILVANPGAADERAFLADFGLVKQLSSGAGLTRTGQFVGSADYVAPEQIEGQPVDERADIYSFSAVIFQALAGHPPFERMSEFATLWAHVNAPPPALSEHRPDLAALDPVLARGMAKSPADRYPTAKAVMADVAAAIEPSKAGRPTPTVAAPRARPLRPAAITTALAAVVILAGAGLLLRGQLGAAQASPSPSAVALTPSLDSVPTNPATASVGPTAGPDETAAALQLGPLAAGRYASTIFQPSLSFTLPDDWTLTDELPQFIQFIDPTKPGIGYVITRFRGAIDPLVPGGRTKVDGVADPESFITWVKGHPYVDPGESAALSFGELRGPGLDFVAALPEGVNQGCPEPCIALFLLTDEIGNTDRYGIYDGWHYRLSAVAAPGGDLPVVVFITEAPSQDDFDAFAPAAFAVTSTVRFTTQP